MADPTMDEFLSDNHDAILAGAQGRMRGDETVRRVAAQRGLSERELTGQVLGFWLQAIRTDVTLGSTAAMAQNLGWLVSLRSGHGLPFEDAAVMRMLDDISAEIDARLESEAMRAEYAAYRDRVADLVGSAFPRSDRRPGVRIGGRA